MNKFLNKVSNIQLFVIFSIENIFLEQKTSFETKKLGLKNEFKFSDTFKKIRDARIFVISAFWENH